MGAHAYHDGLPGYDERQIWHDGCDECEQRGHDLRIGALDSDRFARAWERAAQWQMDGDASLSNAEIPLLSVLWSIQVQFQRLGWPLGVLPALSVVQ